MKEIAIGRTTEYSSWNAMKSRVNRKVDASYKHYGAKGIIVCKRWYKFENFLKDMGKKPKGKTLDRINNNKGYFPSNCRWATMKEQERNRTNNRILKYKGKSQCVAEWAEELNIPDNTIHTRIMRKWPINKILKEYA